MARRVVGRDVKHRGTAAGSKRDLRDDAEGGEAMALGAVGVAACHRPLLLGVRMCRKLPDICLQDGREQTVKENSGGRHHPWWCTAGSAVHSSGKMWFGKW